LTPNGLDNRVIICNLPGTIRTDCGLRPPDREGEGSKLDDSHGMMQYHTGRWRMGKAKIAITIDEKIVGRIDRLVKQRTFSNRSQAIEEAMHEKLARLDKSRLAREAAKLDPSAEKDLAEEGLAAEQRLWPEF